MASNASDPPNGASAPGSGNEVERAHPRFAIALHAL
jgi:hypothetical protein